MPDPLGPGVGVALFGAGGHARAVGDVIARLGAEVRLFPDDEGADALTDGIRAAAADDLPAVLAVTDNRRRLDLAGRLEAAGVPLPPVIAWTATVAEDATLAAGCIVMEHAHVGAAAFLGLACIVNTGAVVEHDCRLRGGVSCGPGSVLTGSVRCGRRVLVGAGAVALPGTTLGDDAVAAAGCVVVHDVAAGRTVIGVPARPADPAPTA